MRAISSAGRARASHARGQRFKSSIAHHCRSGNDVGSRYPGARTYAACALGTRFFMPTAVGSPPNTLSGFRKNRDEYQHRRDHVPK